LYESYSKDLLNWHTTQRHVLHQSYSKICSIGIQLKGMYCIKVILNSHTTNMVEVTKERV